MSDSNRVSLFKNFFAGGFGGACLIVVGYPLDTLKVRLQTMPRPAQNQPPMYKGAFDCAKQIAAKEGFKGFYRGMVTPIAITTPNYAFCFFGFEIGKKLQQSYPGEELTKPQLFKAGMLAGIFTATILAPGERIKCLLQVQAANPNAAQQFKGPIDCVKTLYRQGGIRSLYKGYSATLMREIPSIGVYLMGYESVVRILTPEGKTRDDLSVGRTMFAGGMAGIFIWSVELPFDGIKSRLQTAPEGTYPDNVRDAVKKLIREEGVRGFYRGAFPVFLRAMPANAACFLGYEAAMKFINKVAPNL